MTEQQTPSATWDAMSDEQKVEFLATKVMGWITYPIREQWERDKYANDWLTPSGDVVPKDYWNPLTDWNHWRQVEEKVIEQCGDGELLDRYLRQLTGEKDFAFAAMKADLPDRCKALFLALNV